MTGKILGYRYEIISQLGRCGLGTIYLAVDTQRPTGLKCVVKQLTSLYLQPEVFQVAQELFATEAKT